MYLSVKMWILYIYHEMLKKFGYMPGSMMGHQETAWYQNFDGFYWLIYHFCPQFDNLMWYLLTFLLQ